MCLIFIGDSIMMKDINKYLELLGLSDGEANFYLALLQTGPITVRKLSEILMIPRTTAYNYFYMLLAKGMVMKLVHKSRTLVAATQPDESLPNLVEQKVQAGKTIQDALPQILDMLHGTFPSKNKKAMGEAEIKYYKGRNGVSKIYEEALQAKELRSYANLSIMEGVFPENLHLFSDAFKNNTELNMYEIVEDSTQSRKQTAFSAHHPRYFYKFLPKETELSAADILIYDGKVSIINVHNQITGTVLHNTDYYNNSKELFDLHWKDLPEVER